MNIHNIKNKSLDYLSLIRIHQWFKNLLIVLPVLTTQKTLLVNDYWNLFYLFITFSLVSSLVYIFNDLIDQKNDSKHPIKKNKPIAKKNINSYETFTIIFIIVIFLIIIFTQKIINNSNINLIITYFISSIVYSLFIKKIRYVDILVISSFYVIRLMCGVNGIEENISNLIYIQIYIASLFILICKRYSDLVYTSNYKNIINVYNNSNKTLIILINFLLVANIIIYLLITNSNYLLQKYGDKPYFITTIFVVVSFFKYRQYTLKKHNTIDPVKILFKSKTLILSNVLWVLSIFILNNLW